MKQKKLIFLTLLFTIKILILNSCSEEDECTQQVWYQDSDEDGFGNPDSFQESCLQPVGYILDNTDFDDINSTAFPGADEICDDNIDNNGDGEIYECAILNRVSGNWTSDLGDSYAINNSTITSVNANNFTYVFNVVASGDNYVICLNSSSNPFFANLYS